ncbi:MFS transporter [bacterium]|nr:MFS transporter [bacterium]
MPITKRTSPTGKNYFTHKKINSVIKFLTISDILMLTGFGLVTPIFAIFITNNIEGGTVEVAGLASAIFLITKSICLIPVASFVDKNKGERDDFWAMIFGSLGITIIPLLYIFINRPIELYIVQFFYGFFAAVAYPSWMGIFTRHIDKKKEGLEWGVYETLTNLGAAFSASLGGLLAYRFGFIPLFLVISMLSFVGTTFLIGVYHDMEPGPVLFKKN